MMRAKRWRQGSNRPAGPHSAAAEADTLSVDWTTRPSWSVWSAFDTLETRPTAPRPITQAVVEDLSSTTYPLT